MSKTGSNSEEYGKKILNEFLIDKTDIFPGISIDCVIITFHEKKIKILLNRLLLSDTWMLPGGFLNNNECADTAASRILKERTGLEDIYLRQFFFFSDVNRSKGSEISHILEKYDVNAEETAWLFNRYVSVGYFSFVKYEDIKIVDKEEDSYCWANLDNMPKLYADHNFITDKAIRTIRMHINHLPIGEKLLPEKFTSAELRGIYEGILGKTLDRKNFQKKMLLDNVIIKLDETKDVKTYPRPILYKFNEDRFNDIDEYGFL